MTRVLPGLPLPARRPLHQTRTRAVPQAPAPAVTPDPAALPDSLDLGTAMLGVTALTLVGGVVARALLG